MTAICHFHRDLVSFLFPIEQVRRAINAWLTVAAERLTTRERFQRELTKQHYYQRRNAQAQRSHTKTRKARLASLGIDPDRIKSCVPQPSNN
jgi:hypothetical protein